MADADDPGSGGRRRWLPHLSRAGKWFVGAVATAAIGVLVPTLITGWLSGDDDDQPIGERIVTPTATAVPFPPSRQVSQQKIGLYNVEENGRPEGALLAFGEPSARESEGLSCTMVWEDDGLEIRFYDLGGGDPCVDGSFCEGRITGREWATTKGLQVGESARRIADLYADAEQIPDGATIRWVLETGVSPCGPEAKGGLEAHSGGGRIHLLVVSYAKGGD